MNSGQVFDLTHLQAICLNENKKRKKNRKKENRSGQCHTRSPGDQTGCLQGGHWGVLCVLTHLSRGVSRVIGLKSKLLHEPCRVPGPPDPGQALHPEQ